MLTGSPRILFLDGRGDLIDAYRHWRTREPNLDQTDATFSGQFFDVATRMDARVRAIAWPGDRDRLNDGLFVIEHRPRPLEKAGGVWYHIGQALWAADIVRVALRVRADVLVMQDGPYRWLLAPLRPMGVRLVAVVHNTLWPAGYPPAGAVRRALARAEGWFFRSISAATLTVSPECERQVRAAAKGPLRGPIAQFRPTYDGLLAGPSARVPMKPFRVLYAGRLERDKGLFDLIEVAARLEAIRPGQFVWTICGAGSAEREFVETVETRKLLASITFRGRLRRPELAREYAACDAVLVPTSARFPEGLNRSALEAALSGKPVVISSTAPAAELLGQAALVVLAGDIDGYAAELRRLAEDAGLYRTSCEAALRVGATLVDPSMSFRKVLGDVLEQLLPPTPVGQTAREIRAEAARNRSR